MTESGEGLEAKVITIAGGSLAITSNDDGINGSDGSGKAGGGLYYVQQFMREQSQTVIS